MFLALRNHLRLLLFGEREQSRVPFLECRYVVAHSLTVL